MEPAARAMFTGLELGMGFADLMRAVFEGLCFAARDCYAAMGDIPQRSARHRRCGALAGAARACWRARSRRAVRSVTREEAGAAGAAMMAAVQQKLYPDMEACAAQWVDPLLGGVTRARSRRWRSVYDGAFPLYKETRETMRPVWRAMVASAGAVHAA